MSEKEINEICEEAEYSCGTATYIEEQKEEQKQDAVLYDCQNKYKH